MFTFATCEVPRAIDFIKKMYPDKREQIPTLVKLLRDIAERVPDPHFGYGRFDD